MSNDLLTLAVVLSCLAGSCIDRALSVYVSRDQQGNDLGMVVARRCIASILGTLVGFPVTLAIWHSAK